MTRFLKILGKARLEKSKILEDSLYSYRKTLKKVMKTFPAFKSA